jgi:hypothetical protein
MRLSPAHDLVYIACCGNYLFAEMARFTASFLKKHTRKLVEKIDYGRLVNDKFLLETLRFHPNWTEKAIKEDGEERAIRKDRYFSSYRLVFLNDDGSIYDDISLNIAIRARTGRSTQKRN